MKVYDEMIHTIEAVRIQCMLWSGKVWNIFCNDRFEAGDFEIKVSCEICGPKKFVPKVININGTRLCKSCLTRMIEMLDTATLADCAMDRHARRNLQQRLIGAELKRKEMKNDHSKNK